MHLRCGPFWWACKCGGAIQAASPDMACPGLPRKPLDAVIVTTGSVSPQRPPGQQQTKWWWKHTPTLLAILMAKAMRRYVIPRIAWWRRSRASLEATGRRYRESIVADIRHWSLVHHVFVLFFIVNLLKKSIRRHQCWKKRYQLSSKSFLTLTW